MIQYLQIEDEKYPFLFSMRAVFAFMNGSNLDTLEEVEQEVSLEFDSMLKLYESASRKGAKKEDCDLALSAEEIEDKIDEEPKLFLELQELFNNSKVMKVMNEQPDEKK